MRRLDANLERAHELAANEFDLAVCFSIGFHQLPASLRRFQAAYPAARIAVQYAAPARVHELVSDNAVQLGLTIYPQRWPGLVVVPTRNEPLMFGCHPQHPLAARPAVQLRELQGQPFIAHQPAPHPAHLESQPSNRLHLFEPRREFREVEMVVRLVEIGEGVALLPRVVVREKVAQGVLYRRSRKLTPLMKEFIEFLKQPEPDSSPVGTGLEAFGK